MPEPRRMRLRKETLAELTPTQLGGLAGGSFTTSFESCPTWICTPLVNAVTETVRRFTAEATLADCG